MNKQRVFNATLTIALSLFVSRSAKCQAPSSQTDTIPVANQIGKLAIELHALQARLSADSSKPRDLQEEIHGLKIQLRSLDSLDKRSSEQETAARTLREKIQELEDRAVSGEEEMTRVQDEITALKVEIETISQSLLVAGHDKAVADSLASAAKEAAEKITQRTIGKFIGDVRTWKDLGTTLSAVATTAKGLLLFSESDDKSPLIDMGKVVLLAAGSLGTAKSLNDRDSKTGTSIIGSSLIGVSLLQWVSQASGTAVIVENVSRNRSFTDDVIAFSRSTDPFAQKAGKLWEQIGQHEGDLAWHPAEPDLGQYYTLLSSRRDLTVVIRQMKAKAEYLKAFETVTKEGKQKLDEMIARYNDALDSWESSESVYLSTYTYLHQIFYKDK